MTNANNPEAPKPDDILTLAEIARHLKVSKRTILRMVRKGDLSGAKVGGQWRFRQSAIDAILNVRFQSATSETLVEIVNTKKRNLYRITDLITTDRIVMRLQPASKEAILRQLVAPLVRDGVVGDGEKYLDQLLERENMVSTALECGVAFPHARAPDRLAPRRTAVALGLCPEGADFDALDGQPTYIFLLICAARLETHLRILAKATLMLRVPHMRQALREARTKDAVRRLVMEAQTDLSTRF